MPYKKSHIPNLGAKLRKGRKAAREELFAAVDEYAHGQRDEFVERIEDQRFAAFQVILYPDSGTNLSPRWLSFKEFHGLDLRTMIATGHYKDAIRVFSQGKEMARAWKIGFHGNAMAKDKDGNTTGITLNLLARVHEHGSAKANVPARPHWQPNLNRMKREAPAHRKKVRERVVKAAKKAMGVA